MFMDCLVNLLKYKPLKHEFSICVYKYSPLRQFPKRPTNRCACEPWRSRPDQLLLERVHLHALGLGDLVQVLVPVRERELWTISANKGNPERVTQVSWLASTPRSYRVRSIYIIALFPHAVM